MEVTMIKKIIITVVVLLVLMYVVPFFRELPFNLEQRRKEKERRANDEV
jgi:hypothetical protein